MAVKKVRISEALQGAIKRGEGGKVEALRGVIENIERANGYLSKQNDELCAKVKDLETAFKQSQEHRLQDYNWYNQKVTELRNGQQPLLKEIDKLRVELESAKMANAGLVVGLERAWNGDSGDTVDLERKLDALLGKNATKVLRNYVKHWNNGPTRGVNIS